MEAFPPFYYGKALIIFNSLRQSHQLLVCGNYQSLMIDNIMIFRSAAEKNPPSLSIVLCPLKNVASYFFLNYELNLLIIYYSYCK